MKKALFEFIKLVGFVFVYFLGDVAARWIIGKSEFPKYYWIATGLILVYQIMKDLNEIKNKLEK